MCFFGTREWVISNKRCNFADKLNPNFVNYAVYKSYIR